MGRSPAAWPWSSHAVLSTSSAANPRPLKRATTEPSALFKTKTSGSECARSEQVEMLFEAVRDDRLESLYILAVHTGLRQGELLGLKWEDVDLEAGALQVRRTLTTAKGGPVLRAPKTKASRRTVKLSPTTLEALRSHLERQLREDRPGG